MHRNMPLTPEQIIELRNEVTKVLEANMSSFSQRTASMSFLTNRDFDGTFCHYEQEHIRTQKTLQSLAEFAFTVLSNAELIWEEVHHRQGKLLEVRESLATATAFVEELRMENDEIRLRLEEAETYIQWVEEEKEELDAIYSDRSHLTVNSNRPFLRCGSERTLPWNNHPQKKTHNYEKLRGYVEGLREERVQMEKQLILLAKRYEEKCQEVTKANYLAEHLLDRLNRSSQRRDYLESLTNSQAKEPRGDLADDLLKALEKIDHQTMASSAPHNASLLDEEPFLPRRSIPYFESFTHLPELLPHPDPKETKDASIGTDSFGRKSVEVQTEGQQDGAKAQGKGEVRISISVGGEGGPKEEQVVKIISDLHLEREIQQRLKGRRINKNEEKTEVTLTKNAKGVSTINNTLLSTYEYYRNRLVASRIKKYHFSKPDPAPTRTLLQARSY